MSKILFEKKSNDITRKVLLKGNEKLTTQQIVDDFQNLPFYWSELLLRHESICVSVYGENLPATMMLSCFGFKGLMDLLEQGAIKFYLQDTMITHLVSEIKGLAPLQPGRYNSPTHCDPESSVVSGISCSTIPISAEDKKKLIMKLTDSYITSSRDFTSTAVKFAHEGYKLDRFRKINLPLKKPLEELSIAKREKLCKIATEMHNLSILSDLEMDSLDMFESCSVAQDSFQNILNANKIKAATAKVFELECLPSFQELVKDNIIPIEAIAKHRISPHCVKFRKWIDNVAEKNDTTEVAREYISSITNPGFFETKKGRLIKTICVSGVFGTIGGAIAGPIGFGTGSAVGKLAEPAVDISLDLIDEFLLGSLLKGWKPKNYLDSLRVKLK